MTTPRLLALGLVLGLSAPALAQSSVSSSPPLPKDKEAVTFNEIEKGFFIGLQLGPAFELNAPTASGKGPFSTGQQAMLELGFNIGDHVALSIFALENLNRAGADYTGESTSGNPASGDFTTFAPGVSVRFNIVGIEDAQSVRRTWFYIRAAGAYALFTPKELLPKSDILVFAGPGIEYYTRLRHFSIGVEAVGSVLLNTKAVGFAVTPNLRYSF